MASTRTSAEALGRAAVDAVVTVANGLGFVVAELPVDHAADLELRLPDDRVVLAEVKAASIPSLDRVRSFTEPVAGDRVRIVVADQLPGPAREVLSDAGVSWLDRRGHVRLVGPGLFIDADVDPLPRHDPTGRAREPIAGRSGLAAATALLLRPDDPMGVSEIARVAQLNPSSITRALAAIAGADLAQSAGRGRYRPLVPELFWALADIWPREQVAITWSSPPLDDGRLGFWKADLAEPGWAAAGARAAVAWGAELTLTADYPVHLYAPDERLIRTARTLHEVVTTGDAQLSVDPVGFVTRNRYRVDSMAWPAAHPLFCALDLAVSSRDREALDAWEPPEGFDRVW